MNDNNYDIMCFMTVIRPGNCLVNVFLQKLLVNRSVKLLTSREDRKSLAAGEAFLKI